MGLVDRSPSSSLERRNMNKSGVRRSLDIEESGRRSSGSMGARDLPCADDRPSRDLPLDKSLADESPSIDSSFYNISSQNNSVLIPPPSAFRGGVSSPSFWVHWKKIVELTVVPTTRGVDPNMGRGQGNAWRGAPNWPSPLPNGYIPFQHGPPHGGFQAMMPQFPSPPLFGVRPSMEINHSGIPYHIPDADRFSSHLWPLRWQNMMDGSGPSHMHGWDRNNGVFRDESHVCGGTEWDQNRHPMNGRGWENTADIWKGQNGDANMDLPSTSLKEDFQVQAPAEDVATDQEGQRSQNEGNHHGVQAKIVETKLDISTELTDPELHNQFMSLFNIEQSATADEDNAMLVNLKDGARAVPKSSDTLLSSSLFPATNDTVFQRAMDIYKRQRVEELVFDHNAVMSDVQMLNLDEEKVEVCASIAIEEGNSEVACSQEVDFKAHTPTLKVEWASQTLSYNSTEKQPMMIFSGDKVDGMLSQLVNSEDTQGDIVSNPDDVPNADEVLPTDGQNMDDNSEMKDSNTFTCAEEGGGGGGGGGGGFSQGIRGFDAWVK
ncbi:hypothetical protein GH714_001084 [Hevea brasiliensis]|uniref:Uncharacterized protein n=1 Tax=Hevea brasiliensis TaxID=3981 RepID=A0A6A6KZ56_HEVBR|nr:hypothetical protein GH714_001084 [Hevea brasiliensis]